MRLLRPKTLLEDDKPRRLRLIQLGRLLPDGVLLVPYTTQLLSKRAQLDQAQGHAGAEALREGIQAVGRGLGKVVRGTASAVARGGGVERDELDRLERGDGDEEEREHAPLLEEEEEEEEEEPQAEQQIWLHCSVGDVEEDDQERAEDTTQVRLHNSLSPHPRPPLTPSARPPPPPGRADHPPPRLRPPPRRRLLRRRDREPARRVSRDARRGARGG